MLRDAFEALKLQDELAEFRRSIKESREQTTLGEAKPLDVDAVMRRVSRVTDISAG